MNPIHSSVYFHHTSSAKSTPVAFGMIRRVRYDADIRPASFETRINDLQSLVCRGDIRMVNEPEGILNETAKTLRYTAAIRINNQVTFNITREGGMADKNLDDVSFRLELEPAIREQLVQAPPERRNHAQYCHEHGFPYYTRVPADEAMVMTYTGRNVPPRQSFITFTEKRENEAYPFSRNLGPSAETHNSKMIEAIRDIIRSIDGRMLQTINYD